MWQLGCTWYLAIIQWRGRRGEDGGIATPSRRRVDGVELAFHARTVLRDDEQLESLEPPPPPLDDARERIRLKERVAVVRDVEHAARRVRLRDREGTARGE